MARPSRNTNRGDIQDGARTFFVTSQTNAGRSLLQTERMANLFIDVLRNYVAAKKFQLHDFVVMPNHFHLPLTLEGCKTIEKAVGLVKGNFSYRAKKELGYQFEIWQPGFSDERVWDRESFLRHRKYIDDNPVKAGLADCAENCPYCSAYFRKRKRPTGPKGQFIRTFTARVNSCPGTCDRGWVRLVSAGGSESTTRLATDEDRST